MKRTVWIFILITLLLAACTPKQGGDEKGGHNNHGAGHNSSESTLKAEDVKAVFSFPNGNPKSKQDAGLKIQVQNKEGKLIENFDINHEKKLHLIVVNKDLSYFNHIHPEPKDKGMFEITTQFPAGGEYKLFADFVPTGASAMTKSEWVKVEGEAAAAVPVKPDNSLTKSVDGKEVTLTADQFKAGKEVTLTFDIKDDATKKPITNLQQYLGAVGHVVILTQDAEQYLHVHPMEEKATGPDAKFMTTFPKSGVYKIWGQFQHENKVFTVPFVVQVQ
ncbi:MAG: hypothetical protein K0S39_235 [Paenibacillus sp.]|jgi:hypothetical protein|nr:hypothetical protein [Paenibacillus sp.]